MSVHDHSRFKVVSETQHLYEHGLDEFPYAHPALPGSGSAQDAMDYILNVLYPKIKGEVATPADLPTGVDTPNVGDLPPELGDQRLVIDDGDGNYAMYTWAKWDGQAAPQWNKVADFDFGENGIIQGLLDQTQYLYPRKYGTTDYDPITELALTGKDAGQHFYGGDVSGQNLILHANNGDDPGLHSGFIYLDDDTAPSLDLQFNLGEPTERWLNGYFGTLVVGTATMTITSNGTQGSITDTNGIISFDDENLITTGDIDGSVITASTNLVVDDSVNQLTIGIGSITDSTWAISFGDENLSTTGTLASGVATISSTLVLATGSITDSSGEISFGDENLTTTGNIDAGTGFLDRLELDDLVLDGNAISIATLNTDLDLSANGTGVIDLQSATTTVDVTTTGTLQVIGQGIIDDITLDGTSISVVGNILTTETIRPDGNGTRDLGGATLRWRDLFISNNIHDGTNFISSTDLLRLRLNAWRDLGKTQPAQAGDALFYDSVNGVWLASAPDTEIDHGELLASSLLDDDHTQYALLAGRGTSQVLRGGDASGALTLYNNATDQVGFTIQASALNPSADDLIDIGTASRGFKDIYMTGEGIGFRAENEASGSMTSDAGTVGRLWYGTDTEFLYVDTGSAVKKVGNNSYATVHTNVQVEAGIDVSASIDDARNAVWQLREEASGDILDVPVNTTATTVTTINTVPLPAGNYRLIGIEA